MRFPYSTRFRSRPRLSLARARLAGVTTDGAIEQSWAIEMYASRLPLGDVQQVLAVVVLAQRLGEAAELVGGDEALAPGDLLQAGDLQALAMLDGLHELRGVDEDVVGAGVRSVERRVGKECVGTCRSRWSPYH